MSVRVRFAPSPTGYLHIGGARTALFNWLYARHTDGTFVLRVEDTDDARNTREAVDVILDGLRWLGLDWDEGPVSGDAMQQSRGENGPYFQSQRGDIYQRRIQELLDNDLAYDHEGAIKFRMTREPVTIPDLVAGNVVRKLTDREEADPDFVIVRSDGKPVFHLVNVVDDIEMDITHVIRGEDHLSNTSKHIELFKAFGEEPPKFAHIPLILNNDGSKMSKRDTGASMTAYMEGGYLPSAVLNYLSLLGWSPKDDTELMPLTELIKRFDMDGVQRANARFDMAKLDWLNFEHIRSLKQEAFKTQAIAQLQAAGIDTAARDDDYTNAALALCTDKIKNLNDIAGYIGFFFLDAVEIDAEAAEQALTPENRPHLAALREAYAGLAKFNADSLQGALKSTAAALEVKNKFLVMPARVACTGSKVGPSLYHLMELLGEAEVLKRFDAALTAM
ncbi:MAG TPA: glutamate--tRNA ligase [Verrucomicrobiales bacterium]|jgi:glutamyl-tRNA synthetase|nr:glutamate--tRNA ligase [Verrucomicrobiales bacterium]|tara:strand:- start:34 stop:1377 length:1344 start_codon:yes stop_codon:yes gene_type:complete